MKLNAITFQEKKSSGQKISMVTCYDYTMAKIIDESQIDSILVGDSAAMIMNGSPSTVHATLEMMYYHIQCVVRGAPNKFVIGDLPFLSYRKSLGENMKAIDRLMKAGSEALKLEGAQGQIKLITHIVQSGVPIMGHLGLTPQSVHTLGGHKVQGRSEKAQTQIFEDALKLEDAGCFSLVLECVPSVLAKKIADRLTIPVIGIGAGSDVDGQVLVAQDLLGFNSDFKPKFLRTFLNGKSLLQDAFDKYHQQVVSKEFPNSKESYQ